MQKPGRSNRPGQDPEAIQYPSRRRAMGKQDRRQLLKDLGYTVTGGFAASALGYSANETIRVGCIGTGGRAQVLMKTLARIPGVAIAAVCDVWDENLAKGR